MTHYLTAERKAIQLRSCSFRHTKDAVSGRCLHKITRRKQRARDHVSGILAKDLHAGMHEQVLRFNKHFVIDALVVWFAAAKCYSLMSGKSHIEIKRRWPGDGDFGRSDGALENGYSDPVGPATSVHYHPV